MVIDKALKKRIEAGLKLEILYKVKSQRVMTSRSMAEKKKFTSSFLLLLESVEQGCSEGVQSLSKKEAIFRSIVGHRIQKKGKLKMMLIMLNQLYQNLF